MTESNNKSWCKKNNMSYLTTCDQVNDPHCNIDYTRKDKKLDDLIKNYNNIDPEFIYYFYDNQNGECCVLGFFIKNTDLGKFFKSDELYRALETGGHTDHEFRFITAEYTYNYIVTGEIRIPIGTPVYCITTVERFLENNKVGNVYTMEDSTIYGRIRKFGKQSRSLFKRSKQFGEQFGKTIRDAGNYVKEKAENVAKKDWYPDDYNREGLVNMDPDVFYPSKGGKSRRRKSKRSKKSRKHRRSSKR